MSLALRVQLRMAEAIVMKSLMLTFAAGAMALGLAFAQSGNQAAAPRNQNQNQTCARCGAQCTCANAGVCPRAGGQAGGRGMMRGMGRGRGAMAGGMQCMRPGAATSTPAPQATPSK